MTNENNTSNQRMDYNERLFNLSDEEVSEIYERIMKHGDDIEKAKDEVKLYLKELETEPRSEESIREEKRLETPKIENQEKEEEKLEGINDEENKVKKKVFSFEINKEALWAIITGAVTIISLAIINIGQPPRTTSTKWDYDKGTFEHNSKPTDDWDE